MATCKGTQPNIVILVAYQGAVPGSRFLWKHRIDLDTGLSLSAWRQQQGYDHIYEA